MKNEDVKKFGDFIYRFFGPKEVAVAKIPYFSALAAQIQLNDLMREHAEPTGRFFDFNYNGMVLPSAIFAGINEDELLQILSSF